MLFGGVPVAEASLGPRVGVGEGDALPVGVGDELPDGVGDALLEELGVGVFVAPEQAVAPKQWSTNPVSGTLSVGAACFVTRMLYFVAVLAKPVPMRSFFGTLNWTLLPVG